MKVLLLDIETAPNTAYVWRLFKYTVSPEHLTDTSYVLCWSAKWLGETKMHYDSINKSNSWEMLFNIHKMLEEADAVVHYNGKHFDIPTLNKEFLLKGYTPPSPYKQIDLLEVVRKQFKFASNKLSHVCKELGLGEKAETPGFELWVDCMRNDPEAWKIMEKYNKQDVVLLEKLYNTLLPWIPNHPNRGLYQEDCKVCPYCGGKHYQRRGYSYTVAGKYQRYQCRDCGAWFKDASVMKNNLAPKASERFTNA